MPATDSQQLHGWLKSVAKKDRVAFRLLYEATAAKLFGYAVRIVNKHELAEEVLQESFISIWNNATTFQPALSSPMTWMTTIVRNKAFDLLRRIDHTVEIDIDSFGDGDPPLSAGSSDTSAATPGDALQLSQNAAALATCFNQLEGRHRQAIAMAFYHDLSHGEVAAQLKLPIGTVKSWIRRGLERLKSCLTTLERA